MGLKDAADYFINKKFIEDIEGSGGLIAIDK